MNLKTILSRIFFIIGAFLITLLVIKLVGPIHQSNNGYQKSGKDVAIGEKPAQDVPAQISIKQPVFLEYTTPCSVTANYEFYLESGGETIGQKFPGIYHDVLYNGKGPYEIPEGRTKGPIKFWDPNNPLNGHKTFRIYLVN